MSSNSRAESFDSDLRVIRASFHAATVENPRAMKEVIVLAEKPAAGRVVSIVAMAKVLLRLLHCSVNDHEPHVGANPASYQCRCCMGHMRFQNALDLGNRRDKPRFNNRLFVSLSGVAMTQSGIWVPA